MQDFNDFNRFVDIIIEDMIGLNFCCREVFLNESLDQSFYQTRFFHLAQVY